jgi:alginate O-acetyltransferase complex protein AlgI
MSYLSVEFIIFYILVFIVYRPANHRVQNLILLLGSYIFYGYWDWRFLGLILASTVIDFYIAKYMVLISKSSRKKQLLIATVFFNLSILGFFKYFNFFVSEFAGLLNLLGWSVEIKTLYIILPLGISFFTFQKLTYTVDVYRGKMAPTKRLVDFALFVAFFPQVVSGPIQRASDLLPQITKQRTIDLKQFQRGLFLILFGSFKKIVIADQLANYVNSVFDLKSHVSGLTIAIGTLLFTIQIYCDFSGYTDIARGLAKTLGFNYSLNFNLPYFSKNPREFWSRWHISLSTWLRDYLYIPLGGNRNSKFRTNANLMMTMLIGGLWHGAAWNFIAWGFYHGILLIVHRKISPLLQKIFRYLPLNDLIIIVCFFILTCYGWLLFRAGSLSQIVEFTYAMITNWTISGVTLPAFDKTFLFGITLFIFIELFQYCFGNSYYYTIWPAPFRYIMYSIMIVLITLNLGNNMSEEFIYAQF